MAPTRMLVADIAKDGPRVAPKPPELSYVHHRLSSPATFLHPLNAEEFYGSGESETRKNLSAIWFPAYDAVQQVRGR